MATRMAITVEDDRGIYRIVGEPVEWEELESDLADTFEGVDESEVDYEHLLGWGRWQWGILVNDFCVAFVDGDEPPATILGHEA